MPHASMHARVCLWAGSTIDGRLQCTFSHRNGHQRMSRASLSDHAEGLSWSVATCQADACHMP